MTQELRHRINARRRIYLLRHGEVSYFDPNGRPYPPDGVPLNAEGLLQAEAAREALADLPIDRAISSGLRRTVETAGIVAGGRGLAIETRQELREISPGPLLDPRAPDFERFFTGALAGPITRETRFLGGESFGELIDRVVPAFRAILAEESWREALIVAHGGVNRALLAHALLSGALGSDLAALSRFEQEAGAINVIDLHEDGSLLLRLLNHTPRSPLKRGIRATTMEQIYLGHRDALERASAKGKA